MVTEVDPASPAAEKGIKAGDVIVEIAQEPVASVDDITKGIDKVKTAGSKAVLLRLEGGKGDMRFVALPCGERREPRCDEMGHATGHG